MPASSWSRQKVKALMKPLLSEDRDGVTLQNLGRASLQIIHDIKNQLNGLKLYATYLRKRMEQTEQAEELQETVAKLIGGLDRAANDLNVLVQYGRPMALSKYPGVDLQKIMRGVAVNCLKPASGDSTCRLEVDAEPDALIGDFDATALTDAFKAISIGVWKTTGRDNPEPMKVTLKREVVAGAPTGTLEWGPVNFTNGDPFSSFNGSEAIRMSLAAKIVEAHSGSAEYRDQMLRVRLPLTP
jgi:light-regulated signal transduction histidine kinase (bacteriophytochrome)